MNTYCINCDYRNRCEETHIQHCKLKDNEKVVRINGKWITQRNWL